MFHQAMLYCFIRSARASTVTVIFMVIFCYLVSCLRIYRLMRGYFRLEINHKRSVKWNLSPVLFHSFLFGVLAVVLKMNFVAP